jgi:hypothetical protein
MYTMFRLLRETSSHFTKPEDLLLSAQKSAMWPVLSQLNPVHILSVRIFNWVGFLFLTAASWMRAFWDIAPCSLVEGGPRFRGACCLHHPDHGGSTHLWNVGVLLRDCTALYPTTLSSSEFLACIFCSQISLASVVVECLTLLLEVSGSNLGPETGYPAWGSSWFFCPSMQIVG